MFLYHLFDFIFTVQIWDFVSTKAGPYVFPVLLRTVIVLTISGIYIFIDREKSHVNHIEFLCSTFFQFSSKVEVFILLFIFFQFYSVVSRDSKVDNFANSLFLYWLLVGLVFWPRLGDPSVCQSPKGVYVWHFLGEMLGCPYTVCW